MISILLENFSTFGLSLQLQQQKIVTTLLCGLVRSDLSLEGGTDNCQNVRAFLHFLQVNVRGNLQ
jgi:hypothetical protein